MQKTYYYIIGAGFAGRAIALDICRDQYAEILAFLDDDKKKTGRKIDDIPVLGPIDDVLKSLDKSVTLLIAIPQLSKKKLQDLYLKCSTHGFYNIKILPTSSQLLTTTASIILTREIDPADFLGRAPLVMDMPKVLSYLQEKRILVTGAGGSIGSELCRQLLRAECDRLYILGHGENSIYHIDKELRRLQKSGIGIKTILVPIIGELQDERYVDFLISHLQVEFIFHCAAHKHVSFMENNPIEAIKNNTLVVHFLIEAAKKHGIKNVIFISTDKAVEPSNIYGVSKSLCEKLILQAYHKGHKGFTLVRFGNVLGSSGSLIPLLKEQIADGGPITITHKNMYRYFMTIPEAVSLVLLAGGTVNDTGKYLLEMGKPIRIIDLAQQILNFYYSEKEDHNIETIFIGIKSGEKLREKLYADNEETEPTKDWPRLLRIKDKIGSEKTKPIHLSNLIQKIKTICFYDNTHEYAYRNRKLLREILQEYFPNLENREEPEY